MRVLLAIFIVLISACQAIAQSNSSTVFRFLDLTPTARAAALGGNHSGMYNADFSVFHLNPAYLNKSSSRNISVTYINYLADASMGFTSGAYHFDRIGTFGMGIRFVGYGDFNRLDENGENLGSFNARDLAVSGAFSREILKNFRAGAAADIVYSSYDTYRSSAATFSAGLYYRNQSRQFSAGFSIRNAGAQISTFNDRREPLPLDVAVGISKKPEKFPFQLNLSLNKLNDWDLRSFGESSAPGFIDNFFRHVLIGGEATLAEDVFLRLGYDHYLHEQTKTGKTIDLAGVSFGVGFSVKGVTVDLSRNSYSKIGGITRISLKTTLN